MTWVYRDKTAEARIMQFSSKCSQCLNSLPTKIDFKIRRGSPWSGDSNCGGVDFNRVRDAISRKWCEIELRWQLITNRKSYVGIRLQQKVDDLEWPCMSIHCSVISVMHVFTERLRLESRDFCYKVELYLSYQHIKFDNKTKGNPSNLKHTFLFACVQS